MRCWEGLHRGHQAGQFPSDRAHSSFSRRCSHWWETVAALWKVNCRAVSTGTLWPVKKARSRAMRSHSLSSAHTTTTGRSGGRAQGGGKVGPVYRTQAGHRRRGLSPVQRGQQLLEFRQVLQNRT